MGSRLGGLATDCAERARPGIRWGLRLLSARASEMGSCTISCWGRLGSEESVTLPVFRAP